MEGSEEAKTTPLSQCRRRLSLYSHAPVRQGKLWKHKAKPVIHFEKTYSLDGFFKFNEVIAVHWEDSGIDLDKMRNWH